MDTAIETGDGEDKKMLIAQLLTKEELNSLSADELAQLKQALQHELLNSPDIKKGLRERIDEWLSNK